MDEAEVVRRYQGGASFRAIAKELGPPWTFWKVRQAVLAAGVVPRTTKTDRRAVAEHYKQTRSTTTTAEHFGVTPQTVANYVRALGGRLEPRGGRRIYDHNDAFFDTYTPASCYWAGFIAADGNLYYYKGGSKVVQFMLARGDRAHLEAFAHCAGVGHPVRDVSVPDNRSGATYEEVALAVSSSRWWAALHENFNLEPRKSLVLRPPPAAMPYAMVWHYVRGYFDGDGCVESSNSDGEGRPKQISFICGARPFIEWLRGVFVSHHKIGGREGAWRLSISGPTLRAAAPLLYAGSTPETRLARKYERLRRWLPNE